MPLDGDRSLLAYWKEAGEWWAGKPQREVTRFIDEKGIRREVVSESRKTDWGPVSSLNPPIESAKDQSNSWSDQDRVKIRKEKHNWFVGFPSEDAKPLPVYATKTENAIACLHTLSGYAFGRSTMFAGEIPRDAGAKGYSAALLADPFSLVGAAEFNKTAIQVGVKPLIGASFEMEDGGELVLVAKNRTGYRSLSRLITGCHLDEPRLFPLCRWERLKTHSEGLLCLTGGDDGPLNRLVSRGDFKQAHAVLDRLIGLFGRDNLFIEIERSDLPWQISVNRRLLELADESGVLPVAGGPITHERREHFPAQDMLVCIDSLCLIEEIEGRKPRRDPTQPEATSLPRRALNGERFLKDASELWQQFPDRPDLVLNTGRIAEMCEKDVLPTRAKLPVFCPCEEEVLREVTLKGMIQRHTRVTKDLEKRIDRELKRIIRLGFAAHFLTAWDMCEWASSQGILLSGRGSVVDSAVAYCLGISRIDAYEHDLFFDRFLPDDGSKRPDIDIDFEARRRDNVRNYLAQKYGEAHVATVAAVGTYGTRGIIREVGKVMSIPQESLDYLTKRIHGSVSPERLEYEIEAKPELRNSNIPKERFHWVFQLAEQLMEIPRNMRAHSSGVVISREPLCDIVPVQHSGIDSVPIIQWDKQSAKRCFDKFDVLCLRGNDVLSDTQRRVRQNEPSFDAQNLPAVHDPEVYRTMRAGQLIGIPQSASPAMRQAHIRVRTENLKDAGIVQAAIRPGVGGAVKLNEFVARRRGKPYTFSHPLLEKILERTYGIVVFQEQIDMLLQEFGKYSSDDAELIREAIYKQRRESFVEKNKEKVITQIQKHGHSYEVALEVYNLVAAFKGYGFAEGHALAFAEISIRSIWCQQRFPAPYFAALLDAQPAGYYGPCTIANEARSRGVKVLPPDVNKSSLNFGVEDYQATDDPKLVMPAGAIRVALNQISGVSQKTLEKIVSERHSDELTLEPGAALPRPYASFFDFVARVRPDRHELERLILCGALDCFEPNRRTLLWAIPRALEHAGLVEAVRDCLPLDLFEPFLPEEIEPFGEVDQAIYERSILGLDIEKHLMAFERERVRAKGGITAVEAGQMPHGTKSFVVGNPIRLRFPPTSSGKRVMFFDLEDESGLLNVTCFDDVYQKYGHAVICNPYITLFGESQVRDGHTAFLAQRILPFKPTIQRQARPDISLPIVIGDFLMT
jgi:error-prone DNA polymerase